MAQKDQSMAWHSSWGILRRSLTQGTRLVRDLRDCESGSISVRDILWVPLFAAVMAVTIQLGLTLHSYGKVHSWAHEAGQSVAPRVQSPVQDPGRAQQTDDLAQLQQVAMTEHNSVEIQ